MRRRELASLILQRGAVAALVIAMGSAAGAQQPRIMRSPGAPEWGTSFQLVEEIRIGKLDGAEEYVLGEVDEVAVGRNGAIFVADGKVPVIRMYDAQGRFVRNVGRKGAGPGEYARISGMRALPDGRVAIWDNEAGRITVFSPAGDLAATHRAASGLSAANIFQVDRDGRFYVRTVLFHRDEASGVSQAWIRVSPTGQMLDTILIPTDPNARRSFVLPAPSGNERPFPTELVWTMSSLGYLITGRNDSYAFDQHRPGAPVLRIEHSHTPVRLAPDERREWEAWALRSQRNAARPPSAGSAPVRPMTPGRADYSIPEMKPAFSELSTDSQGRIWVRRYVQAQSRPGPERQPGDDRPRRVWREPPTFDVFEPAGRFLGTVTLPFNASFHDAIDRHVWATVRGESDEPYVVRLRIESRAR